MILYDFNDFYHYIANQGLYQVITTLEKMMDEMITMHMESFQPGTFWLSCSNCWDIFQLVIWHDEKQADFIRLLLPSLQNVNGHCDHPNSLWSHFPDLLYPIPYGLMTVSVPFSPNRSLNFVFQRIFCIGYLRMYLYNIQKWYSLIIKL